MSFICVGLQSFTFGVPAVVGLRVRNEGVILAVQVPGTFGDNLLFGAGLTSRTSTEAPVGRFFLGLVLKVPAASRVFLVAQSRRLHLNSTLVYARVLVLLNTVFSAGVFRAIFIGRRSAPGVLSGEPAFARNNVQGVRLRIMQITAIAIHS